MAKATDITIEIRQRIRDGVSTTNARLDESNRLARYAFVCAVVTLAAVGCAASSAEQCRDAPVLRAPESGCTVVGIEAAGEDACLFGETMMVTGSWVRVTHAVDRAAHIELRVLSLPSTCQVDGTGCPSAHVSRGSAGSCGCATGDLDSLPLSSDRTTSLSFPLLAPEHDVLLRPAGAVFEVSVCGDDGEPFPTCDAEGACLALGAIHSAGACACLPPCATDADCPQPRTGGARARCEPLGCTLPCGAASTCPEGQACAERGGTAGPICMTQL